MLFKDHQKLTLVFISEMLAQTVVRQILLTGEHNGRQLYKARGRKRSYFLKITHEMLVFDGWSIPYAIDNRVRNSLYNFVTDTPRDLRIYLRTDNLNKTFNQWMNVYWHPTGMVGQDYTELFNEEQLNNLVSYE